MTIRAARRCSGTLDMRAGKVERMHEWLAARLHALRDFNSVAYSDSIIARERGWRVARLHSG